MEKKICRFKVILDYLDQKPVITEFSDRLLIQKLIYFVQFAGINLGYRHSWYLHGPYSPELTKTAYGYFENEKLYNEKAKQYQVSSKGKNKLNHVKDLIAEKPDDMELCDWLELLSSIHYLIHIAYYSGTRDRNMAFITEKLRESGKARFTDEQIKAAWEYLEKQGLTKSKMWSLS